MLPAKQDDTKRVNNPHREYCNSSGWFSATGVSLIHTKFGLMEVEGVDCRPLKKNEMQTNA